MYSRPPKATPLETVTYEIDMLRFCLSRLSEKAKQWDQGDKNLFIEGFLLHFRNLTEFFSGKHHKSGDDLSTCNPQAWCGRALTPEEQAAVVQPAAIIDDRYFRVVSKYLQHCTTLRHDQDRDWDLDGMYAEINPVIEYFERCFFPTTPKVVVSTLGTAVSTATITKGDSLLK